MKAWLLDHLGDGIQKLHVENVADPVPGAGEVVVDLKYAGLNPADRYVAENLYPARPTIPHILGRDGLGIISTIGSGISEVKIGEDVVVLAGDAGIHRAGTFAEKLLTTPANLAPVPRGWSDEEAAGAPLVYNTAYQALSQWGPLPRGGIVLISGASGGVGVASVQLAKAMGYVVIGLSRNATKGARLRELGANAVFDPTDAGWKGQAKAFMESLSSEVEPGGSPRGLGGRKRRVDLAIDSVGGDGFADLVELLADHGRVSCVGRLAGPVPAFNTATLFFRRIRIGGVAVHSYTLDESRGAWAAVTGLLEKIDAKPVVDSVHRFEDLKIAFDRLEKGPMGKVLLKI